MMERINGFVHSGRLGYFYGKNAIISVAIDSKFKLAQTGAVCTYQELKRLLQTEDKQDIMDYINGQKITKIDGEDFTDLTTMEDDYNESYVAQVNLKRIVDTVQQRAVILSISNIANEVEVKDFIKFKDDGIANDAEITSAQVVSFLIERADVFNKDVTTFQGVPSGRVLEGYMLLSELNGLPLYTDFDTTEQVSTAPDSYTAAVGLYYRIPAQY